MLRQFLILILLVIATPSFALEGKISTPDYGTINIYYDSQILDEDLAPFTVKTNYLILVGNNQCALTPVQYALSIIRNGSVNIGTRITLVGTIVKPEDKVNVIVSNLTSKGEASDPLYAFRGVKGTKEAGNINDKAEADMLQSFIKYWKLDKSKSKDDSDIYLKLSLDGTTGSKATNSTEFKFQKPLIISNDTFVYIGTELATSSKKDGDPDNVSFYVKPSLRFNPGVFVELAPKLESNFDFKNINFIVTPSVLYEYGAAWRHFIFYLRPSIGFEFGKNLKSPLPAAEGDVLIRFVPSIDTGFILPIQAAFFKEVTLNTTYTPRILLKDEINFDKDKDGSYVPINTKGGLREHIKVELSFDINDFYSVTGSYEYGFVPPQYKKIDNKYLLGFTFKAGLAKR